MRPCVGVRRPEMRSSSVLFPAPFGPTMPKRSPGSSSCVKGESTKTPSAELLGAGHEKPTASSSTPLEPSRWLPNDKPSSPWRAAASGRALTIAFAASTRAFGLVERAGAPRRNHASSFVAKFLRTCSSVAACASRSIRAARYAA